MSFNIDNLNSSILDVVTDMENEYEATESVDFATRCANLKPGAPVPAKGGVKLTDNLHHIENYGYAASSRIFDLCDAERTNIKSEMSAAPSEEALRTMQAIGMRSSVSKAELDALADKYGNCYQVRRFVSDQMVKNDLGIPEEDPCDTALKQISRAESIGMNAVDARRIGYSKTGKAARLAIVKQNLKREGLFSFE